MRKKSLTLQQILRVKKKQQAHLHPETSNTSLCDGLVITCYGQYAEIEDSQQQRMQCSINPELNPIVAGDRIVWKREGTDCGVIISQYPRQSVLARTNKHGESKVIAANITQLCVVVASQPRLSWLLLDSYLIMAELLNLDASIIVNKSDLDISAYRKPLETIYAVLNYPVILTQTIDTTAYLDELQHTLHHHTNIFVGQSGVGKSSLIKRLLPHEQSIATGALSEHTAQGCHTTSRTTLYHLACGGALIDSPGIRSFDLSQLKPRDIAWGFREFQPWLHQCKFRDCKHVNTKGCAILDAVNKGHISHQRHENYVKINAQL